MGEMILLVQEVNIVRTDQPRPHFLRQLRQFRVHRILLGNVFLHFDEKSPGTENIQIRFGHRPGRLHVALHECRGHLTPQAGAGGDQPFAVLPQNFLVDARLVIKSFFISQTAELLEIVVSFEVF